MGIEGDSSHIEHQIHAITNVYAELSQKLSKVDGRVIKTKGQEQFDEKIERDIRQIALATWG